MLLGVIPAPIQQEAVNKVIKLCPPCFLAFTRSRSRYLAFIFLIFGCKLGSGFSSILLPTAHRIAFCNSKKSSSLIRRFSFGSPTTIAFISFKKITFSWRKNSKASAAIYLMLASIDANTIKNSKGVGIEAP
jgi:hypothetical protein